MSQAPIRSVVRATPAPSAASRQEAGTQARTAPLQWSRPAFQDLRFGFEVTMYVAAR